MLGIPPLCFIVIATFSTAIHVDLLHTHAHHLHLVQTDAPEYLNLSWPLVPLPGILKPLRFCSADVCLLNGQDWLRDSLNEYTVAALLVIMLGLKFYHSVAPSENPRDSFDPPSPPAKRYG